MFDRTLKSKLIQDIAGRVGEAGVLPLSGLWGSSAALVAAALGRLTGRPVLFVAGHLDQADEVADDVEVFTGRAAQLFPAWEVDVASLEHVSDEVAAERLRLCSLLAGDGAEPAGPTREPLDFIVASAMALMQPVPTPRALAAGRLEMSCGLSLPPEALAAWLVDAGYERLDQVEEQGEFAHRGGIVDVFPPGAGQPVRVEYFGDRIESLRRFDLDSQRSAEPLERLGLHSRRAGLALEAGAADLLDYLDRRTLVCIHEPGQVSELAREIYDRLASDSPPGDPDLAGIRTLPLLRPDHVLSRLEGFGRVAMHAFRPPEEGVADLGIRSLQRLAVNTPDALAELEQLSRQAELYVYCENVAEQRRFLELLESSYPALGRSARTLIGHVAGGFHWASERLIVVGHHEIFHRYAKRRRIRRVRAGRPIDSLLDLSVGDYVVHVAHGIARFEGLRQLQRDGPSEEYLRLRFAGNAVLHVPASQINLVQRYIGARHMRPALSRLGGTGWAKRKQRVGEAVADLAAELLRVQAMRQAMEGLSYPRATDWQRQFSQEFIYTETDDQLSAMEQVDADMALSRPMDRLLCGDVGYGKTELAMRAAFKVVEAGKQAAVLVPTTVLADQHYRTFRERMADYPFVVEMLSRFRGPSEQAQILRRLSAGQVDIVIGTHRLLSGDVKFADLGLVVIDEEQRFGVEHKERLKALRACVDVLTMTATPIPRTLHMALLGLRDISSLATPPLDRRAIYTEVCHYDERLIRQAILRELARGGQVFFVHNRVLDIEPAARRVRELVPEARVRVGHGQMRRHQLEKTMLDFVNQRVDVLVCTTIIESGLDIPTANTIVIHNADRFGLAELHQLRGRVGRYKHRAFCYLLLPRARPVSPAASKRLKAIEEFSDLGAGFQIAMRDLEIRGAGNILGPEQSGHIATVGYELYCQLLESAVHRLRGTAEPAMQEAHVELGIDAMIPSSYIPSDRQRMDVYRRLARCRTTEDLRQLQADLDDAFGRLPPAMLPLLELAEARLLAGQWGIRSIIRMDPDLIFDIRDFKAADGLFEQAAGTVRVIDDHTVHWRLSPAHRQMPAMLRVLLKALRRRPVAV
jgi:transcription-repair coupling factor (superfamily II helicase)